MASDQRPVLTMAIFGDSIAAGLGVRNARYSRLAATALGAELVDYASTAATVEDSLARFRADPRALDIAVIAHGVTEPIIRPDLTQAPWLPHRWRRPGWMDPRPYYSRRLRRQATEKLESALRWRVKNALMRRGSTQFVSLRTYVDGLQELVTAIQRSGCSRIHLLEPTHIDGRFFPGSNIEMLRYASGARRAVQGVNWIPIRAAMKENRHYFLDGFHPNEEGHQVIASLVTEAVARDKL